jgi:hypothetical protein
MWRRRGITMCLGDRDCGACGRRFDAAQARELRLAGLELRNFGPRYSESDFYEN